MADKKAYYKLDEVGFLGTQEKQSAIQKKADIKKTAEIIRTKKTWKVVSFINTLSKAVK